MASYFNESVKSFMNKHLLYVFLFLVIFGYSCHNGNEPTNKHSDTVSAGNTDSSGSQPIQTSPGAANGGNATDTIANHNDLKPRTDSVIRH
jgi:hypothetical protein